MINWYYGRAVLLSTVTSTNPGSKLLYQATVTDRGGVCHNFPHLRFADVLQYIPIG